MQNRRVQLTSVAKHCETRRLTGMGPSVACQEVAAQVFGRFWKWTEPFFRSRPGPLVGNPDLLLTPITSKCTFSFPSECCSESQMPVLRAVEVPKHWFASYHMLIVCLVIVPAENSDDICYIRPSGSHRIDTVSDHWFGYVQITRLFIGLSLVKLQRRCCGNWSGLVHSELRQDRLNVA